MTASRLQDAALRRFAQQGFEATTLNEIATDVGIKKPSIYAHFKNKDELYLSLIPILIAAELAYAESIFTGGKDASHQVHQYLAGIRQRFDSSHHMKFWMRSLWMPPVHLEPQVLEPLHVFMDSLESIIKRAIQHSPLVPNEQKLSADVLAKTCMSFIDCLQSELLYGGPEKYEKRLQALWKVFNSAVRPV